MPLDAVAQSLARVDYFWVALAVSAAIVQTWLRGVRWILLYYPHQSSLRIAPMWAISTIGQMLNIVVPWRVGELARIYLASEIAKQSKTQTLATLATEKIFDTLMLLLLLLTIPMFMALPAYLEEPRQGIAFLSATLFVAALGLLVFREQIVRALERVSFRGRNILQDHARVALNGLDVFTRADIHFQLQLFSIAIWFLGVLINYLCLLALNLSLPFVSALVLMAVLQLGGLVPSSPGKVGVFQLLCILALALFGVDKGAGLSYGILLYLVAYAPPVILGILFLWWGGVKWQGPILNSKS
ncbi:MAG: flippase-like domain-containing protein [Chloroflexi bacterium]|nr:flippase-like domain-containing protein [Chloroflexota bacterium]